MEKPKREKKKRRNTKKKELKRRRLLSICVMRCYLEDMGRLEVIFIVFFFFFTVGSHLVNEARHVSHFAH